jgi:predicted dehydrogenase
MRAAVLGCGMIGAGTGEPHPDVGVMTHCGAYTAHPETELVAVADPERAQSAAERWHAKPYADTHELLEAEQPEIVSVATPDHTHAELVEACLNTPSVKAVLAEKPLAMSLDAARALVAKAQGRILAVNYNRRFTPAFRALADELGEIQHVSGVYVKGLKHNGTHWLDLLRLLAGEPTVSRGWDRLHEPGEDPSLDAELSLGNGAGVRLAALDTTRFTAFEMDLILAQGRVRILEGGHVIERYAAGEDPRNPGYRVLGAPAIERGALRDGTLHAVTDVVRCVNTGETPACSGQDAVEALALAESIRAAAGLL